MAKLPLVNSDKSATIDDSDLKWAKKHVWLMLPDGHIARRKANGKIVYLCNEVMSRAYGVPLSQFGPPKGAEPENYI